LAETKLKHAQDRQLELRVFRCDLCNHNQTYTIGSTSVITHRRGNHPSMPTKRLVDPPGQTRRHQENQTSAPPERTHSRPSHSPPEPSCSREQRAQYKIEDVLPPSNLDLVMGEIFIRCPRTGVAVPTGLNTQTIVFKSFPQKLPHCPQLLDSHFRGR